MKILIVSDTHRKDENLKWVIRKTKPFDMLIHLGDAEGSEYEIMKWVDKDCDLEMSTRAAIWNLCWETMTFSPS